ncbi:hypothetical protein XAP412_60004 [Xanthomonas phaseoli pv. phaseoli]|nr:hypothetical protein XAP412_60004 [Xanthomonas phaseoli pv. phaseoli]
MAGARTPAPSLPTASPGPSDTEVSGPRGAALRTGRGQAGDGLAAVPSKAGLQGEGEGGSLPAAGALSSALKPRVRG